MKRIFINDNNLQNDELDYEVIRVKGLVINDKDEILLAHNNNTYQLVGGHLENTEDMEGALIREIREETGMLVEDITGPFMQITTYAKDYFNSGKNVCSKIYYYRVLTNNLPDKEKCEYDELERQTDFNLFYVKLKTFAEFIKQSITNGIINKDIGREMLLMVEEYNKLYGKNY